MGLHARGLNARGRRFVRTGDAMLLWGFAIVGVVLVAVELSLWVALPLAIPICRAGWQSLLRAQRLPNPELDALIAADVDPSTTY